MPEGGEQSEKLSLAVKIAYGMGNMLNVLGVNGLWFPYASAFYAKVLQLGANDVGTILLVAQISGGIFAPMMGIISDLIRCPLYGSRKFFHLVGLVAFAGSFFFLWHDCFGCGDRFRTTYYSSFTVVFELGFMTMQITQLALLPELASTKQSKVELNSIRFGFRVGGNLLSLAIVWILLETLPCEYHSAEGGTETEPENVTCGGMSSLNQYNKTAFWVAALIFIVLGLLMAIPFHVLIHEEDGKSLDKLNWYKWLMMPEFYLVLCTFAAAKVVTILALQFLPFYFLDTLGMTQVSVSIGPLVFDAAGFAATLGMKTINKHIDLKMMYFIGVTIAWAALVWFWFQPATSSDTIFNWKRDLVYLPVSLLGFAGSTLTVVSLSLVSIMIREYTGSGAFVFGMVLLGGRVVMGSVNKIVMSLLGKQEVGTSQEKLFVRHVMVLVPILATFLGLAAIGLIFLLDYYQRKKEDKVLAKEGKEETEPIAEQNGYEQSSKK